MFDIKRERRDWKKLKSQLFWMWVFNVLTVLMPKPWTECRLAGGFNFPYQAFQPSNAPCISQCPFKKTSAPLFLKSCVQYSAG